MVAQAGKILTGMLRGMRSSWLGNPDETFAPLSAWIQNANWGGTGRGVGLRRAPSSLLDQYGNPSPYLADNSPFVISQAEAIGPSLRYDMLQAATRLEEKRRIALMGQLEREQYLRNFSDFGGRPPYTSYSEDSSVEELLAKLASREYAINALGHDPSWYAEDFTYNNYARAHEQIMSFSDALKNYDFSQINRGFNNPYYGTIGSFLPKQEFVVRPPASPFTVADIPF